MFSLNKDSETVKKCNRIDINFVKQIKNIKGIKIINNRLEFNSNAFPLITSLLECNLEVNIVKRYQNFNNIITVQHKPDFGKRSINYNIAQSYNNGTILYNNSKLVESNDSEKNKLSTITSYYIDKHYTTNIYKNILKETKTIEICWNLDTTIKFILVINDSDDSDYSQNSNFKGVFKLSIFKKVGNELNNIEHTKIKQYYSIICKLISNLDII
jgi:hypothetical protein